MYVMFDYEAKIYVSAFINSRNFFDNLFAATF